MAIILTIHAKGRIELRGVPHPETVKLKRATDKDVKQLNIGRRLKPNKVGYYYKNDHDCYLYICLESEGNIIVLTAYKYDNFFQPTGNRKKK